MLSDPQTKQELDRKLAAAEAKAKAEQAARVRSEAEKAA